jgi:hypothetical protein
MQAELLIWGDGTIRLSFWDSLKGEDRIFILGDDGQAYVEEDDGSRSRVDLVVELREMASA